MLGVQGSVGSGIYAKVTGSEKEVRMYNRPLAASEIATLYSNGIAGLTGTVGELVQSSDGGFYDATGGTSNKSTVLQLVTVPELPQLAITPSGTNVILSWPTNPTGFTLEFATNLASPNGWNTNSTAPLVISGQNTVTNPMNGNQMFFRLSQ
jgi:hypothetical protein